MDAPADGVLLYYHYVRLDQTPEQQQDVRVWFVELCERLGLVGRVRVAQDGINVTLGGPMAALREHAEAVQRRFGGDIDFKLQCSNGRRNQATRQESGFDCLRVQCVKEVVSLRADWPAADGCAQPARHVSPQEWHALLEEAASGGGEGTVLLDARNFYETRIGRFEAPGVPLIDPGTRCFSELPAFLDAQQRRLAGRRVLMYCTGGVRCERASAYVRSLGAAFQDVVQLRGGIQRYLESYPDGGAFRGKNFVFDERADVAPAEHAPEAAVTLAPAAQGGSPSSAVGSCLVCGCLWDDYGPRRRCGACRMLVLVCNACCASGPSDAGVRCELCRQRAAAPAAPLPGGRRLRILCLHGFRQGARNFEGRTAGLRRRLKDVADFVFVDGPHQLPAYTKPRQPGEQPVQPVHQGRPKRAWLVTPQQFAELYPAAGPAAGTEGQAAQQADAPQQAQQAAEAPQQIGPAQQAADYVDEWQYTKQTAGWGEALGALHATLRTLGPFDGVLGFSQGAAVAAALCALQQEQQPGGRAGGPGGAQRLWFAVLCSGYVLPGEWRPLMERWAAAGGVPLPSLHVFGAGAADRQIGVQQSAELAECFDARQRAVLRHGAGHLIPSTKAAVQRIRDFLLYAAEQAIQGGGTS